MRDPIDDAASLLRELFASIDQLCECQGNKAKLEMLGSISECFLDLQDIVKHHGFSIAVANGEIQDDIIAQA